MKREITIDMQGLEVDAQYIKDMERICEDIDTLISGEKAYCVLNVLLNLPLAYMIADGRTDSYIMNIVKKIVSEKRNYMEECERNDSTMVH